jgi:hypothetical protein
MKTLLLRLLVACLLCAPGFTHAAARPNFGIAFIDDMGWGDFSCFGNQDAQMPNVDRLADEKPGRIWADAERLGQPVTWMPRARITGGFVAAAIPFIEQAARERKPFYINLWPDT